MSHTILDDSRAYEMMLESLNEMPVSQKTITLRKDEQFFTVRYEGGGYWLYDNVEEIDISPLLPKQEVVEDIAVDMHALYLSGYTLELNRQVYKLRNY